MYEYHLVQDTLSLIYWPGWLYTAFAACTVVRHPSIVTSSKIRKDRLTSALESKLLPMEQCNVDHYFDQEIQSQFHIQQSCKTSGLPAVIAYENGLERFGLAYRRKMRKESIDRTILR
jgi:hypothetical protein